MTSLRLLLTIAAEQDLEIRQFDIATAFLNGHLDEEIYVEQPEGFITAGNSKLVCKLNRSLYGLTQSPRIWNQELNQALNKFGFIKSKHDHALYIRHGTSKIYLAIYVDDGIIIDKDLSEIKMIEAQPSALYTVKLMGDVHCLLGITITRNRSERKNSLKSRTANSQPDLSLSYSQGVMQSRGYPSATRHQSKQRTRLGKHFLIRRGFRRNNVRHAKYKT